MKIIAVIPARYQSTRFLGKPLKTILGKPMIQHVYERVRQVPLFSQHQNQVIVATDTEEIAEAVKDFGGIAEMTSPHCVSGTERMIEVMERYQADWILNVQGDEPLISPQDLQSLVEQTLHQFQSSGQPMMGTLIYPIQSKEELQSPHVVKVVLSLKNRALYFSRSAIPFQRNPAPFLYKHFGVYCYHQDVLKQYARWSPSHLEQTEQLEQLRFLENDLDIFCTVATQDTIGVDTPEDLARVEEQLAKSQKKSCHKFSS